MRRARTYLDRAGSALLSLGGVVFLLGLTACVQDTGQPCNTEADCVLGDTCLTEEEGFPGGYCTTENCDVSGCPDPLTSECFSFPVNNQDRIICLALCDFNGECTRAGYDCYDVDNQQVCLPTDGAGGDQPVSGAIGSSCTDDPQCTNGLCLTNFPSGYCSQLCSADADCPSGSHCEQVGSQSFCYRDCQDSASCRSGYECSTAELAAPSCVPSDGTVVKNPNGANDGESCVSDINCKGGVCLKEAAGHPGGYCTTLNCDNDSECNGGICTVGAANTFCRTACSDTASCRSGYECITTELTSGTGATCQAPAGTTPAPTVGGDDVAIKEVTCSSGGQLSFNVSDGATGFYIAPFSSEGRAIAPTRLTGDNGVNLDIQNDYDFYRLNEQFLISITPLLFPGSDQARFEGARDNWGGNYTLDVNGSGEICGYIIESPSEGQVIDVNFYLVGVPGVDAGNPLSNGNFSTMLDSVKTIFGNAGVSVGTTRFPQLSSSDVQKYSVIRDFNDVFRLTALSEDPGPTANERLSVNVFLILDFAIPEVPGLLGISPGVPGASGVHRTTGAGLVFSSVNLNDSPSDLGQTMAHEIGHFLGLRHTSEHGGGGDPISDTAECADPQDGTRCPDANNFMFPFSITGVPQQEVSGGQQYVLRRSALIK